MWTGLPISEKTRNNGINYQGPLYPRLGLRKKTVGGPADKAGEVDRLQLPGSVVAGGVAEESRA
eukprot:479671-Amorphochlora_amoeboformis.AAC.3